MKKILKVMEALLAALGIYTIISIAYCAIRWGWKEFVKGVGWMTNKLDFEKKFYDDGKEDEED